MMIRAKNAQLTNKLVGAIALFLGLSMAALQPAHAESGWSLLNMTPGVTEISRKIYGLHMEIFWICVIGAIAIWWTR